MLDRADIVSVLNGASCKGTGSIIGLEEWALWMKREC